MAIIYIDPKEKKDTSIQREKSYRKIFLSIISLVIVCLLTGCFAGIDLYSGLTLQSKTSVERDENGLYYLANKKGKRISDSYPFIEPEAGEGGIRKYYDYSDDRDGLCIGYLNKDGLVLVKANYTSATDFHDGGLSDPPDGGYAEVSDGSFHYILNAKGECITPEGEKTIFFNNGFYAGVKNRQDEIEIIDHFFKKTTVFKTSDFKALVGCVERSCIVFGIDDKGRICIIRYTSLSVCDYTSRPTEYTELVDVCEHGKYAIAKRDDGTLGLLDKDINGIDIDTSYEKIEFRQIDRHNSLYLCTKENGIIDLIEPDMDPD